VRFKRSWGGVWCLIGVATVVDIKKPRHGEVFFYTEAG